MDYQNPQIAEIYDLINPWAQDADFYLSLAGERSRSVLDLGCGTGTLCCAFGRFSFFGRRVMRNEIRKIVIVIGDQGD